MDAYKQLIDKFGRNEFYRFLGLLKIEQGDKDGGVADIIKAFEKSGDVGALIRLADIYIKDNDTENALKALEQAAKNTDGETNASILKHIGRLAMLKNDFELAAKSYEAALETVTDDANLYYLAGSAYAAMKGSELKAQEIFDEGLARFPEYTMLRIRSAYNLLAMDEYQKTIDMLTKIDEVERELQYYMLLSYAYSGQSDHLSASNILEAGLKENPYSVDIMLALADQYVEQKRFNESITILEKAIEIEPESAVLQNFLGYLYADMNINLAKAEELIDKALAQDPDNYAYLDSKGWVLFRRGMLNEAEIYLQKALNINPTDLEIAEHISILENMKNKR
jgi:tetratricopeptide (TPR) repeat protein